MTEIAGVPGAGAATDGPGMSAPVGADSHIGKTETKKPEDVPRFLLNDWSLDATFGDPPGTRTPNQLIKSL